MQMSKRSARFTNWSNSHMRKIATSCPCTAHACKQTNRSKLCRWTAS